jgi:hypothetical protein
MKLSTTAFVEHRTAAAAELLAPEAGPGALLAPGACTTCLGSTCCSSCCCGAAGFQVPDLPQPPSR